MSTDDSTSDSVVVLNSYCHIDNIITSVCFAIHMWSYDRVDISETEYTLQKDETAF